MTTKRTDKHAVALGYPAELTPYVFAADTKRRLLYLTSWPAAPTHLVTLPLLKPEQTARIGGRWTPRLLERFDDGSALALWDWIPDDALKDG